jgi:lipopolysaccharide/colanic/teichoic acid biosynthesis glycosyltransferase
LGISEETATLEHASTAVDARRATAVDALRRGTRWFERCFDISLTIVALPLIVALAIVIALAIYLDSPGPVLYRSRRVGRGGEMFEMLKFRKMHRDAGSDPLTTSRDERFTPIGRFLAETHLDELPQIVNVLRGEMRLVGPRPELPFFTEQFVAEYADILAVTPGITGNAQLLFVDEKRLLVGPAPSATYTDEVLPAKILVDLDYVRSHTLAGDGWILARTLLLPFSLLAARRRSAWSAVRLWIVPITCAVLLALVFVAVFRRLP